MNYKTICPVCQNKEHLNHFNWGEFYLIHCDYCELDYCSKMIEKEIGGNSSPVNSSGIKMMSDIFHTTNDLAMILASKRKNIYEKLLNRDCKKVLEVGCGPGVFYKPWTYLKVEWTGIEINPYWKDFGKENGVPISIEPIDSIKQKYDVVMAHQVIEHVEDPVTFLENIKNVLNPRGIIHLELPNQYSFTARLRKISSKLSNDYGFIQPPMHLRAYSKKTIKTLFNRLHLSSKLIYVCGNTDKVWGQVRKYNFFQKLLYSFTGVIGLGSLLIGIAQLNSRKEE